MQNHYRGSVAQAGVPARTPKAGWLRRRTSRSLMAYFCLVLLAALLGGCGGGGGDEDPDPTLYAIGGNITGLDGTVVLQNNGAGNLSRSANGAFTFTTRLPAGSSYAVTVQSQPAGQSCQVNNGAATVGNADVTGVSVVCQAVTSGTDNADLAALVLSSGSLDPAFATNVMTYTSTQPFPVATLQVTPTAQSPGATLTVNGAAVVSGQTSTAIALTAGATTPIAIVVTAANGTTTRTYNIAVSRESASGFAQQAYIKASNPDGISGNTSGSGDQFGYSIALSGDGNTLAIGSLNESSNATGINGAQGNNLASESGAVYVFARSGGVWVQQAYVKASNADASDRFGHSVTLSDSGDVLAVGAFAEDGGASGVNANQADNSVTNAGAAYVFTRTAGVWAQQAYLKASNLSPGTSIEYFGWSVSLSGDGNLLAVGAPNEDSNATGVNGDQGNDLASASGAVYVFSRSGATWTQQAYVKASNTQANDQFGVSVRLSSNGGTLAVGAPAEDSNAVGIDGDQTSNAASYSGAVYVYVRNGGSWSQQAYIKASNTGADDQFGYGLAISANGDTLAVGAPAEDSSATGTNGDQMSNAASNSGAVYMYHRAGGTWSQQAYVKASNTGAGDQFGASVALSGSGNTLAAGASPEDGNATGVNAQANDLAVDSGAAYVFVRGSATWSQGAYVKASNTQAGDLFGLSTALSGDGDTLASGAPAEDSHAPGINGDQAGNTFTSSGAAYVFTGLSAP